MPTNGERNSGPLVWLDLEMTGLDVERHVIVEIAALVTDDDLEPLDDGIDLIVHQPPDALAEMDDFVRTMHTKSGLLPEIEASTLSLADAGAQVLEYVRGHVRRRQRHRCAATPSASTGGSSTASCPSSTSTCTTAASTCRASRSCAGAGTPRSTRAGPSKNETHRALADVRDSIAEMRYYREHMLRRRRRRATRQPSSSRRAPSRVVTDRSRAAWPMRPMRQAWPANSPSPPPTSMP